MLKSLDNFKSNLTTRGTVSANRYDITFTLSRATQTTNKNGETTFSTTPVLYEDLTYRCESINIPGVQLGTTDYKLYGGMPSLKIPNTRSFDEVQMTFLATGDMKDKYIFEEWIDKISDFTNNNVSYYNDCSSNIKIDVYNEPLEKMSELTDDNGTKISLSKILRSINEAELVPVYSLKLIMAIPTRVETVQVGWGEVDQLFKYTVNFSYEALEYIKSSNVTDTKFNHLDKSFK